MWGMQTNGKKKLRKALRRVDKVVIMDIRRQLDQQRKWKAEVVKRTAAPKAAVAAKKAEAKVVPMNTEKTEAKAA